MKLRPVTMRVASGHVDVASGYDDVASGHDDVASGHDGVASGHGFLRPLQGPQEKMCDSFPFAALKMIHFE